MVSFGKCFDPLFENVSKKQAYYPIPLLRQNLVWMTTFDAKFIYIIKETKAT